MFMVEVKAVLSARRRWSRLDGGTQFPLDLVVEEEKAVSPALDTPPFLNKTEKGWGTHRVWGRVG
jgi:hypothetical protein